MFTDQGVTILMKKRTKTILATSSLALVLAGTGAGVATAQTTTTPAAPGTATPAAPTHPAKAGTHPGHHKGQLGRAVHGEFTVHTKTGDKILDTQRGVVTAVNAGSVTVKSTDGYRHLHTHPHHQGPQRQANRHHHPNHHQRPGTGAGHQNRNHRHPHRRRRSYQVTHHQVCRTWEDRFRVRHNRAVRGAAAGDSPGDYCPSDSARPVMRPVPGPALRAGVQPQSGGG